MTCKDCIHFNVCDSGRHIGEHIEDDGVYSEGVERDCVTFERKQSEWISVEERLPTVAEQERGLVGIINGFNGKIRFENARVFLNYDYNFNEWYSQDYDIQNCKIECWMPLPEAPKKGGEE